MKGTNRLRKPGSVKKHLLGRVHSASEVFDYNLNKTQEEINESTKILDELQGLDIVGLGQSINDIEKKSVQTVDNYINDITSGVKSNNIIVSKAVPEIPTTTSYTSITSTDNIAAFILSKYNSGEWDDIQNTMITGVGGPSFIIMSTPIVADTQNGGSIAVLIGVYNNGTITNVLKANFVYSGGNLKDYSDGDTVSTYFYKWNLYKKNIPIVDHANTVTSLAISPDVYHVWGEMSELTITLENYSQDGLLHEYMFEFQSGATPTTFSLPNTLRFGSKGEPEIEANMVYEFHIQQGKVEWDAFPTT